MPVLLDMGTYAATYQVGEKRTSGSFVVYACRSSLEQIRFVGIFMREGATLKGDAATQPDGGHGGDLA